MVNTSESLMEITLKGGGFLSNYIVAHYTYVVPKSNSLNEEKNDEI